MTLIRRLAIRLLRADLDARENAARTLAAGAYQEGHSGAGRRGGIFVVSPSATPTDHAGGHRSTSQRP